MLSLIQLLKPLFPKFQVNFLTKQLRNAQFHNAEFEASDFHVYSALCRYCNEPHMSIDCQMENPFA